MALALLVLYADLSSTVIDSAPPSKLSPALMRELASGERPIAQMMDARYGFYFAGDGVTDEHLCGAELARRLPEIRQVLAGAREKEWTWYDLACDADSCGFSAAEFETGATYRFRRAGAGWAFIGVEFVEGGARDYRATYRALEEARRRFARCPDAPTRKEHH